MRMGHILAAPLLGAVPLLAVGGGKAAADFLWFGGPKERMALSISVEDNVSGGCWQDRDRTVDHIARTLTGHGIDVDARAPVSLVLYAIGHPSATGRYRERLSCVGVLQIRVSSFEVSDDRSYRVTSLYDQERLLVSRHVLDRVIGTLAVELVDNFSRRYAEKRR
jgi:hypothetical protein